MEYEVVIRNAFATFDIVEQLSGRGSLFFRTDDWISCRPFVSGNFDPHLSPSVQAQLRSFTRVPVYSTADFTLYQLSSKGSLTTDYYHLPNKRVLIYERQAEFAYWEPQTVPSAGGPLDVTVEQLKAICPPARVADLSKHVRFLNDTMRKYQINTRLRQVHFLSQLAHESAHFAKTLEGASGKAYEGRQSLGNNQPGDGPRFKGRGLIQLTGRDAYTAYGRYVGRNLTDGDNMKLVEEEPYASDCAGWFWAKYKPHMNEQADRDNFIMVTKLINGGTRGIDERRVFYNNAKQAFSL